MIVETFGPFMHKGMLKDARKMCSGCVTGCSSWLPRRCREPAHICGLTSANALKHRRWDVGMVLLRDEDAVQAVMNELIDKVSSLVVVSSFFTIMYFVSNIYF